MLATIAAINKFHEDDEIIEASPSANWSYWAYAYLPRPCR